MRKKLFLVLALLATAGATFTAPKAEAVTCSWECGPCGLICPCQQCAGPRPFCVCIIE